MSQEIIKVKNFSVRMGKKKILDNLNIDFKKGESVVIAGRNGSGKSTFLRCLVDVILPDQGQIDFCNGITKEKIGFISDQLSLFEGYTVQQGIHFHSSVFAIKDFDYTLVDELKLDKNQKIKSLSMGQRTLFQLSLLLSQRPEILLVDEIIHSIDPYLREKFLEAVIDLMGDGQATVIMVNHTFSEIEKIPERVLVMEKGRFILDERTENLSGKIKRIESDSKIPTEIPCIFKKETEFHKEYFIYPFNEELEKKFPYEYKNLNLNDMIKAFVGGQYVKERNN
jgi:ABC-type multidrug transport system ATPase subunit